MVLLQRLFSSFIDKARRNGPDFTAFDAMKFFAILNMTFDHIGMYFFSDDLWLRMIGRITFPVWFFLVGYSRSRAIGNSLIIYTILLIASKWVTGYNILPLNALFSVIMCQIMLVICERDNLLPDKLPLIIGIFVPLSFFTLPFFEYGSIAFLFALFGRMVREKEQKYFSLLATTSYVLFIGWQLWDFHFPVVEAVYVIIGSAWVVKRLTEPMNKVLWSNWEGSFGMTCITLVSRNTLFYYFIHRIIFEIASRHFNHSNQWFTVIF